MSYAVYCLCSDARRANAVLTGMRDAGLSHGISVLLQDRSDTRNISLRENAARGAGIGGAAGAAGALLALTIPGIGAAVAAGPLVAMMGGAAAGGVVGGLAGGSGALGPLGIPEEIAERLHRGVNGGAILIAMHSEDVQECRRAVRIFKEAAADEVYEVSHPSAA